MFPRPPPHQHRAPQRPFVISKVATRPFHDTKLLLESPPKPDIFARCRLCPGLIQAMRDIASIVAGGSSMRKGNPVRLYTPYGHSTVSKNLLGFNGEFHDPISGLYALGNGFRSFSTTLMRFIRPDDHSPFGQGGPNTYAYCLGDPINYIDPSGKNGFLNALKTSLRKFPREFAKTAAETAWNKKRELDHLVNHRDEHYSNKGMRVTQTTSVQTSQPKTILKPASVPTPSSTFPTQLVGRDNNRTSILQQLSAHGLDQADGANAIMLLRQSNHAALPNSHISDAFATTDSKGEHGRIRQT
ncbi:RHS repeat-associated core domain-containing protein [Pseudomonas sp. NPDC008258]|uniref:RHS repeat-associated core domain-containing protein n=1 Tax=Pseudomonas sp. NPDC008258 TaxID=3364418 RepID=UPI0036EB54D8